MQLQSDSDNQDAQADEQEALAAIFGDEFNVVFEPDGTTANEKANRIWEIQIYKEEEDVIKLIVDLHADYPSNSLPSCSLIYDQSNPSFMQFTQSEADSLIDRALSTNSDSGVVIGDVCVYQIAEFLKNEVIEYVVASASSSTTSTSAAHTSTYTNTNTEPNREKKEDTKTNTIDVHEHDPFIHSESFVDRKSVFQCHSAIVHSEADAKRNLELLLQNRKIESATHNMVAWIVGGYEYKDDDGESGASQRMLHVMRAMNASDIMIVVTRWYGGIKLGPDRFKHIMAMTRVGVEAQLEVKGDGKEKKMKKGKEKAKAKKSGKKGKY